MLWASSIVTSLYSHTESLQLKIKEQVPTEMDLRSREKLLETKQLEAPRKAQLHQELTRKLQWRLEEYYLPTLQT